MEVLEPPPGRFRNLRRRLLLGGGLTAVLLAMTLSYLFWLPLLVYNKHTHAFVPGVLQSSWIMDPYWRFFSDHPQLFQFYIKNARRIGLLDEIGYWKMKFAVRLSNKHPTVDLEYCVLVDPGKQHEQIPPIGWDAFIQKQTRDVKTTAD